MNALVVLCALLYVATAVKEDAGTLVLYSWWAAQELLHLYTSYLGFLHTLYCSMAGPPGIQHKRANVQHASWQHKSATAQQGNAQGIYWTMQHAFDILTAVAVPYSPALRSTSSSPRINLKIINNGNEDLAMYWVNYQGSTVSYGKAQAGKTWSIITYGTHPWIITNPSEEIVGIFVPYTAARDTEIIIKWAE